MNRYLILFTNKGKAVATKWQEAATPEDAELDAEFAMACHYGNVEYDTTKVIREEKGR